MSAVPGLPPISESNNEFACCCCYLGFSTATRVFQLSSLNKRSLPRPILYTLAFVFLLFSILFWMTNFNFNSLHNYSIERMAQDSPSVECGLHSPQLDCFFQVANVINPYQYEFLIHPSKLCGVAPIMLLIIIPSRSEEGHSRAVVRNTWASIARDPKYSIKAVFLLGMANNSLVQETISDEAAEFGDIVQGDFVDSYMNLMLKTQLALRWASQFCAQTRWIMKADTDVFVNVPKALPVQKQKRIMFGYVNYRFHPFRRIHSKWYISAQQYPFHTYPPYADGPCYVLSGDLAPLLFEMSQRTPYVPFEDVFLGKGTLIDAI